MVQVPASVAQSPVLAEVPAPVLVLVALVVHMALHSYPALICLFITATHGNRCHAGSLRPELSFRCYGTTEDLDDFQDFAVVPFSFSVAVCPFSSFRLVLAV